MMPNDIVVRDLVVDHATANGIVRALDHVSLDVDGGWGIRSGVRPRSI